MKKLLLVIGLLVGMSGFAFADSIGGIPALAPANGSGPWFLLVADNPSNVGAGNYVILEEDSGNAATVVANSAPGTFTTSTVSGAAGSGVISWNGTLGTNWTLSVDTGEGSPKIGPGQIHLDSVDDNGGGGNLLVAFSQTGISTVFPAFTLDVGGVLTEPAGSYVAAIGCEDNTEAAFGNCGAYKGNPPAPVFAPFVTTGPFGPGSFSGSSSAAVAATASYSLSAAMFVHTTGVGSWSGNAALHPVPEPSSLLLMGLGLIGLVGFGGKKLLVN